ncbi:G-protein coupled receptor 153 [Acinetobacter pittii]|uniref:hypothetical protein n=1 Tax=Acinetobacter pittii TaxID=48296 RepID=UPI0030C50E67
MRKYTLFEIYPYEREIIINSHKFYVEQAKKRLLSQFDDLDNEIEVIAQEFYEESGKYFDPDFHDPDDFVESAYDKAQEYVMMLWEMRTQTLFSIIAGMYHQWDKTLREWMVRQSKFWGGENLTKQIWKVDISKIFELFKGIGWNITEEPFYKYLDACRLVVNIYKHGNGISLKNLREDYPEYFIDFSKPNFNLNSWYDHTSVIIVDGHFENFASAIKNFWERVPERIIDNDNFIAPKWVKDALDLDYKR